MESHKGLCSSKQNQGEKNIGLEIEPQGKKGMTLPAVASTSSSPEALTSLGSTRI